MTVEKKRMFLLRFHYRFEIRQRHTRANGIEWSSLVIIKLMEKKEKPFRGAQNTKESTHLRAY